MVFILEIITIYLESKTKKEAENNMRLDKKEYSLYINILIRAIGSIAFMCSAYLRTYFILKGESLDNIPIKVGLIIMILVFMEFIGIILQIEGIFKFSDPLNNINKYKYRVIIIVELLYYFYIYYLVNCLEINNDNLVKLNYFSILAVTLLAILHISVYITFMHIDNKNVELLISKYKLKKDINYIDEFFILKTKIFEFMMYIFFIGVGFKYIVYNTLTVIVFATFNIFCICKLYHIDSNAINVLFENTTKYMLILILEIISSTLGLIFIYFCYKNKVNIPLFYNRSCDEMYMVFILFYLPIYFILQSKYFKYKRMCSEWVK